MSWSTGKSVRPVASVSIPGNVRVKGSSKCAIWCVAIVSKRPVLGLVPKEPRCRTSNGGQGAAPCAGSSQRWIQVVEAVKGRGAPSSPISPGLPCRHPLDLPPVGSPGAPRSLPGPVPASHHGRPCGHPHVPADVAAHGGRPRSCDFDVKTCGRVEHLYSLREGRGVPLQRRADSVRKE